jgi:hypothetical protein
VTGSDLQDAQAASANNLVMINELVATYGGLVVAGVREQ